MKRLGTFLITVGTTLTGLFAFFPDLATHLPILRGTQLVYILISIAVLLVGAALISAAYMKDKTRQVLARLQERYQLKERIAVGADIDGLIAMARRDFRVAQDSDSDDSRYVHNLDQKFIHVIEKEVWLGENATRLEIVGYHLIYRLTVAGEQAVKSHAFNAARPPAEHVVRKKSNQCAAIYIGAVVAKRGAPRAFALTCVQQRTKHDPRFRSAKAVYARAFTPDGLRTLKDWQFTPLPGTKAEVGSVFSRSLKDIREDSN